MCEILGVMLDCMPLIPLKPDPSAAQRTYLIELHRTEDVDPLGEQFVDVTEQVSVHRSTAQNKTFTTEIHS